VDLIVYFCSLIITETVVECEVSVLDIVILFTLLLFLFHVREILTYAFQYVLCLVLEIILGMNHFEFV
jgi:hypothetical protein